MLGCGPRPEGLIHEATGVHHPSRRCRGRVAARGRAQQPAKIHRIGILETVSSSLNVKNLDALRRGLRELGYVESRNYILEYRSADGHGERFRRWPTNWSVCMLI